MGRPRSKLCPDCNQYAPSTAIICDCGGSIVTKKAGGAGGASSSNKATEKIQVQSRRTVRTKRGKPTFYDSLELEKKTKEERKRRRLETKVAGGKPLPPPQPSLPPPPPAHRMQLTVKRVPEEPGREIKEEDLEEIVLSDEKRAKFALILEDINRKISASSWKGYL